MDDEPVCSRQIAKSVGCSKNFKGKSALDTFKKVTLLKFSVIVVFIKIK